MRKKLIAAIVGVALASAVAIPTFAADVKLHGHVPPVVSKLQPKGRVPTDKTIDLSIGLPVRNREVLSALLQQMYDPSSQNYRRYLTPEQFTQQFGPTEQDYQAVIDFARKNGFEVVNTAPNRMLVDVRGNAGVIEKAFHVTLRTYQHPTEKREFFAPDTEPSVVQGLAIQDISGLSDYPEIRPMSHRVPAAGISPAIGSGPGGSYIGKDFRTAYVPGTSLTGKGQMVGLLQLDGYFASDIANYVSLAGYTNIPVLQNVLLNGFNGSPGAENGEVCLDIEMAIAMAPELSKIVVFEAPPSVAYWNSLMNAMAASNQIKQLSSSWGYTGGGPDATTHQIFQQMALQGQTFFQASGDGDAWVNPIWQPADDPYITVVGGTTLSMSGSGSSYSGETVWNWGDLGLLIQWFANGNGFWGSGGGVSSSYAIPYWQTNINMTARGGSATMRNIPDVALTADNVLVASDGGSIGAFGGTSCAAPLWAGYMALVNQYASSQNAASPGFINPALYTIANGTNYANCFHDVVVGNNTSSSSPNLFYAANNYDLCTGLGTPNGTNLIFALAGSINPVTHISPPLPPYGSNLAAVNGSNPNGNWALFVQDDTLVGSGMISSGWTLNLTAANVVGTSADLELLMTSTNGSAIYVGHDIAYVLTVTNYGPSVSTNVIVSDSLPAGVTIVSTNTTVGSVSRSGSTLVWNVGTLGVGSGGALTLVVHPITIGTYLNYALASAGTPDPNPDEDSATISTDVVTLTPPQIGNAFKSTNGKFSLTLSGPTSPTATAIVQASTNLMNWANVYTSTPPFTFTDPNSTNYPTRFYRVMLVP